jgi:hypothetical protein
MQQANLESIKGCNNLLSKLEILFLPVSVFCDGPFNIFWYTHTSRGRLLGILRELSKVNNGKLLGSFFTQCGSKLLNC